MHGINRAKYQQILYNKAVELGVDVRLGCRVAKIEEHVPAVTLSDGQRLVCDIVVGADGMPLLDFRRQCL